ncbi:MAG: ornithine cyclodeaminase family protein [Paracoccaceae bacterium]
MAALPHLSAAALDALALTPAEIRDALADTIRARAAGQVLSAPKSMLKPGDGRLAMTTLALDDQTGVMVVKALVQNPANPARGLASVNGAILALDAATGLPLATLDGPWITAQRTAALSMLAAQHLARPEAATVAFLGAGVQAQSHLAALAALYPLTALRVWSRTEPHALSTQAATLGLPLAHSATAREAIAGADIVISTLGRAAPPSGALDAGWLAPGSFAALVDLGHDWAPAALAALDLLAIDDLDQERSLPPDTRLAPLDAISGDLPALVAGTLAPRRDADQRTAFLFRGPAFADLSLAALALARADLLRRRVGANPPPPPNVA